MTKVLQSNLKHCSHTSSDCIEYAKSHNISILLIQEPYVTQQGKVPQTGYHQYGEGLAIILLKIGLPGILISSDQHTTMINYQNHTIASIYIPPNISDQARTALYQSIEAQLQQAKQELLIGGDFNSGTAIFPQTPQNAKSITFDLFLAGQHLQVENYYQPTWHNYTMNRHSLTDYTLTRNMDVGNWEIDAVTTTSDHDYLLYTIPNIRIQIAPPISIFNKDKFKEEIETPPILRDYVSRTNYLSNVQELQGWIMSALNAATSTKPRKYTPFHETKATYKIQKELRELKQQMIRTPTKARLLQRHYRALQQTRHELLRKNRKENWRKFITSASAWGKPYKILVKNTTRIQLAIPLKSREQTTTANTYEEALQLVLVDKFPALSTLLDANAIPTLQNEETPEIALHVEPQDIKEFLQTRGNTAPGYDNIRYKHLQLLHNKHPMLLTNLVKACLKYQLFPNLLKRANLSILLKPNKNPHITTAYRPLSLLSCLGKILEYFISIRIKHHLQTHQNLHPHQYGFREGKSTEDTLHHLLQLVEDNQQENRYTLLVSLDIEAAFDSMTYQAIIQGALLLGLPMWLCTLLKSYLTNRIVHFETATRVPEKGTPQGAILGPLLWNIGYNHILHELNTITPTLCFADDTLLVITAATLQGLEKKYTEILSHLIPKLTEMDIRINETKTEPLLIYPSHRSQKDRDTTGGLIVLKTSPTSAATPLLPHIKYLGIQIDEDMCFTPHIQYLYAKSIRMLQAIRPLMPNKGGYTQKARTLMYKGTIGAIWKYCSTIYSHTLVQSKHAQIVDRIHRQVLLRVTRSYRTVSYIPLTVIANWAPLRLQIHQRSILDQFIKTNHPITSWHPFTPPQEMVTYQELNQHLKEQILLQWQTHWDTCPHGAWTKHLIPQVNTLGPPLTFWITQALSGHGTFGEYLHRFGRRPTPECALCGISPDTPLHALTTCTGYPLSFQPVPIHQDWHSSGTTAAFRAVATARITYRWRRERQTATNLPPPM